jgi:hypothetical protein
MFVEFANKSARRHGRIFLVPALLIIFLGSQFLMPVRAESKTTSNLSTASTDPDSTKQKYELNDPRNPDCPCHAAQKLAEEEYRKQQEQNAINNGKQNGDPANKNNPSDVDHNNNKQNSDVNTNKNISGTSSGGSAKHYSKSNASLKQLNKWMKHMKRQLRKKNNGTKKGKRRLANCFHFN